MTTGWQQTLAAARASALNDVDDVSAFVTLRRSVRPAGVGHTSGCTNFGFVRLSSERHVLLREHGDPSGTPPHCESGVRRSARADRGVCESNTRRLRKHTPASLGKQNPFLREAGRALRDAPALRLRNATWMTVRGLHSAHCFGSSAPSSLLEQADGTAFGLAKRHRPSGRPQGATLSGMTPGVLFTIRQSCAREIRPASNSP